MRTHLADKCACLLDEQDRVLIPCSAHEREHEKAIERAQDGRWLRDIGTRARYGTDRP